jgi:uncharacterized protein YndB with AHSA1/START domain
MFDLVQELAAIHRRVVRDDSAEIVTASVSRTYDADAADVWDAITNPERLPRWFYPITGDLREGGNFQLAGNAGGDILHCEKPTWLQVTFGGPDSILDLRTSERDGETTVELIHTVPLAMARSGAGALFVGPGWDGALLGLGMHLRGEVLGDPLEMANSPEIVEFNRGSIEHWTTTIEASGSATAEEIAALRDIALAQFTIVPE